MDTQKTRRKGIQRRRFAFHNNRRNKNKLTQNMLLLSNADSHHSTSSPSTHSTPPNQSNNSKRLQRRHIIKPVTSNTDDAEERFPTTQTNRETYIINGSLVIKMSDVDLCHSFKPFLSIMDDTSSPLSTPPLPSISIDDTSQHSLDLTDVNSVSSIEDISSNQDGVLIDLNDDVESEYDERLVSNNRETSVRRRGKQFISFSFNFIQ